MTPGLPVPVVLPASGPLSGVACPGGLASGIKIAGGGALFRGGGSAQRTEHAIKGGVADAKPVFLADEMVAQMIMLDPAAEPRSRLIGNMRDVMHPFIMQDRQHPPEQRGSRGLRPEHEREQRGSEGEVRHQKPDRQKQKIQPVRLDMMVVMQAVRSEERR